MTFVVYDYGIRTQTPWYDVLPPRAVEQTSPAAEVQAITRHDQIRGGREESSAGGSTDPYSRQQEHTQRQRVVRVGDLMSRPAMCVAESTSLVELWQRFESAGISHMPVVNAPGQSLCGLVSLRDLLWNTSSLASRPRVLSVSVKEIMTRRVIVANPDTEIRLLAAAMMSHRIGCMPVLDDDEVLVGMVTRSDLLRTLGNHEPLDLWG